MENNSKLNRRRFIKSAIAAGATLTHPVPGTAQTSSTDKRTHSPRFGARQVRAGELLLALNADEHGIELTRICNLATGLEHLTGPSEFFELVGESISNDAPLGHRGMAIDEILQHGEDSLSIAGHIRDLPLSFLCEISSMGSRNEAVIRLKLKNHSSQSLKVRATVPRIRTLETKTSQGALMAAIPQEAAGVISLGDSTASIGMPCDAAVGLPHAMNTMEVVSVYDPHAGGGVYFSDRNADLDQRIQPIQFTLNGTSLSGHWKARLSPGEQKALPDIVVGVHGKGDWHEAVKRYVDAHQVNWTFPTIPAWFRDQGAIYSFSGSGGGGIYMEYPQQDLKDRIRSFEDLPDLLDEAMRLGTNILYLWDYWEGTTEGGRPPYWNKGDYTPRRDLGGDIALKKGIRRIHEKGGRVILYLEPFIIFEDSQIGKTKGSAWAGRTADGVIYHQYPQNYSMVPCFSPWQNYIVATATRLVRDFDADGIFLDSWGWQMNWEMKTAEEGTVYSLLEYNRGVLELARRVRQSIRAIKPDAVVMGESTSGALGRYWDGGLTADFAWLAHQNQNKIVGSPVRYGMPQLNVYTNGRNLSELNQVFAAGHNLALLNANLSNAEYIRRLVAIRQRYKDVLIYGEQSYQPKTGDDRVFAYDYRGRGREIITVVNTAEGEYSGYLKIVDAPDLSRWQDALTGDIYRTEGRESLHQTLPAGSLRVLVRQ